MATRPPARADEARRDRDARTGAMRAVFERAGFSGVEPPLLQPADVFLDRSGEDIRRRLYVFTDPGGQELCLRPDLTIPTCRVYLENGGAGEARLCYSGAAFSFEPQGSGRPTEFVQTGAEFFGAKDAEAADAEMLVLAAQAVRAGGLDGFDIEMGDLALFDALVDALDIPAGWRTRLKRHFWRPAYFKELVARLATNGGERADERSGLLAALDALDEKNARSVIEDVLDLAKIAPVGGRSVAEIAERFLERAADRSAAPLSKDTAKLIDAFLALSMKPKDAAKRIRDLTKAAGIKIDKQIGALERRFELIEKKGVDLSRAKFETGFGRTLEYYTGFVFELRARGAGAEGAVAGGGRYDGLLQSLGAKTRVPAIGCAVTLERLNAALSVKTRAAK
ncbi:MAG: ATP phosphoribosyltransferase regulatory subunit [Parvibaculum sp.]|uniref:ATP phosphoribosyltransferase regulatory subunit n=1 Tax=Parvibaculum sp. TaxID=2024848 RepID=UPI0025FDBCE5|nr:ATP phosphoribosyltransferase regulatory subunit [Parvibaculum sp.]MCE9650172.1 ATP phosphoribosyltransferase regulatory subunit [Parvibaculum sp.]